MILPLFVDGSIPLVSHCDPLINEQRLGALPSFFGSTGIALRCASSRITRTLSLGDLGRNMSKRLGKCNQSWETHGKNHAAYDIWIYIYIYVDVYITRVHVCEANFLHFFLGTAWLRFCCDSLRSNAQSLRQAPMVAMNGRRMLDVMVGHLNRGMLGYVFCCGVQQEKLAKILLNPLNVRVTHAVITQGMYRSFDETVGLAVSLPLSVLNGSPTKRIKAGCARDTVCIYSKNRPLPFLAQTWAQSIRSGVEWSGVVWGGVEWSGVKWQTPIRVHSLPSACGAGSCLLCCQPELSLNRYLPHYREIGHDRLSVEARGRAIHIISVSNNGCTSLHF